MKTKYTEKKQQMNFSGTTCKVLIICQNDKRFHVIDENNTAKQILPVFI